MTERTVFKSHDDPQALAEVLRLSQGQSESRIVRDAEIIIILNGVVMFSFRNIIRESVGGDKMLLLFPGAHLSMLACEDSSVLICRYPDEIGLIETLWQSASPAKTMDSVSQIATLDVKAPVERFVRSLTSAMKDNLVGRHYLALKLQELILLLEFYYDAESLRAFFKPILGSDQMFRNFIYRNITRCKSITELKEMCNMSYSGFWHRFRRATGESPRTFMALAKSNNIRYDLVCSDIPIKEISEKYGFGSIQVFTEFCKKNLGNTPGRIRTNSKSCTAFNDSNK